MSFTFITASSAILCSKTVHRELPIRTSSIVRVAPPASYVRTRTLAYGHTHVPIEACAKERRSTCRDEREAKRCAWASCLAKDLHRHGRGFKKCVLVPCTHSSVKHT
eukprot:6463601-Amphidinium_carterae.1